MQPAAPATGVVGTITQGASPLDTLTNAPVVTDAVATTQPVVATAQSVTQTVAPVVAPVTQAVVPVTQTVATVVHPSRSPWRLPPHP